MDRNLFENPGEKWTAAKVRIGMVDAGGNVFDRFEDGYVWADFGIAAEQVELPVGATIIFGLIYNATGFLQGWFNTPRAAARAAQIAASIFDWSTYDGDVTPEMRAHGERVMRAWAADGFCVLPFEISPGFRMWGLPENADVITTLNS